MKLFLVQISDQSLDKIGFGKIFETLNHCLIKSPKCQKSVLYHQENDIVFF